MEFENELKTWNSSNGLLPRKSWCRHLSYERSTFSRYFEIFRSGNTTKYVTRRKKKNYFEEKKSIQFYITPVALQCRLTVSPSVAVTCRMQCDYSEQELGIVELNIGEKYRSTYFYIIRKTWQPTRPFVGSGATLGATWNHFCQIMKKRHHMQRKRKSDT